MRTRFADVAFLRFYGALALGVLTLFAARPAAAADVSIPDANLEATLRAALGFPAGPLQDTDLAQLTTLDASGRNIANLTGIDACTGLTVLDLENNLVEDLGPLEGLTGLTELYVQENLIEDLSPLSGLTALVRLYAFKNFISDLAPLVELDNLTWLLVWENQISDVSPVAEMPSLTHLNLGKNLISGIIPISTLGNLVYLSLDTNQVTDISPLASLINLTHLILFDNQIEDVSAVSGLDNLQRLVLGDNQICEITGLLNSSGLGLGDTVELDGNPLSGISCAVGIPALSGRGVVVTSGTSCDGGGLAECGVVSEGEGEGNPCGLKGGCNFVTFAITVLDAQTQAPLPGAFVNIQGTNRNGTTNGNGVLALSVLKLVTYGIRTTLTGYVDNLIFFTATSGNDVEEVVILLSAIDNSPPPHSGDSNGNGEFDLSETLRVVQLFNARSFHCAPGNGEDNFDLGPGLLDCERHACDYELPAFSISLSELLRMIQLYSFRFYESCPFDSEDGFCPAD